MLEEERKERSAVCMWFIHIRKETKRKKERTGWCFAITLKPKRKEKLEVLYGLKQKKRKREREREE